LINSIARLVHGRLATGLRSLAFAYVSFWSWVSRTFLPVSLQRRVPNSICSRDQRLPDVNFAARRVRLGART